MAEDPPVIAPDDFPAPGSTPAAAPEPSPAVPATPAPVPRPTHRFSRPRLLPWVGLLLLVGCLRALLRDAPTPGLPRAGGGRDLSASPRSFARGTVAVVLDAGHGGADTGAVANGLAEKDLTLDLARRVSAVLERRGVSNRLTRTDDRYVPLSTRARLGNAAPGAVFVSLHLNHADTGARGIETFYTGRKVPLEPLPAPLSAPTRLWRWVLWLNGGDASPEESAPGDPSASAKSLVGEEDGLFLAQRIQTALVASTSAIDRGVKERSLYVTRHVRGAAVLVESGFLSNSAEARLLGDPAYRQRLAESIAGAIVDYLQNPPRSRGVGTQRGVTAARRPRAALG